MPDDAPHKVALSAAWRESDEWSARRLPADGLAVNVDRDKTPGRQAVAEHWGAVERALQKKAYHREAV